MAINCGSAIDTNTGYLQDLASAADEAVPHGRALQAASLKPLSPICKQFRYKRYFRVSSLAEFEKYGQKAKAGDLIELLPGQYLVKGVDGIVSADPGAGFGNGGGGEDDGKLPSMARKGTITGLKGTASSPIVFCGTPGKTIIDGADSVKYAKAAIRVVRAKYIRVAGFTLQNVLKGIDIQGTTNSEFSYLTTRNTLQEGIRLRYNSQYNIIKQCTVTYTGLMYSGVGEGVYCGTSGENSVELGLPPDRSDYNVIRNNTFGPGMLSESVDVKEFTSYGQILENYFDGTDLAGENGGISWVAIKGNSWTIANNTGSHLPSKMVGFRVLALEPGQGDNNVIEANVCEDVRPSNLCVYVDPIAQGNEVACTNTAITPRKTLANILLMCNCIFSCGQRSAVQRATPAYTLPDFAMNARDDYLRYDW